MPSRRRSRIADPPDADPPDAIPPRDVAGAGSAARPPGAARLLGADRHRVNRPPPSRQVNPKHPSNPYYPRGYKDAKVKK